ncbi:hypothetical protein SUGI_0031640 [Cryptomeria japonica]|nr:hypothetical protein SUGI_0031640 [Cryptomeria japonica]
MLGPESAVYSYLREEPVKEKYSMLVYILNANLGSSNIHLLHLQYWCSFSSDLSKNDTFQCITQDEYQSPDEKKGIDAGLI